MNLNHQFVSSDLALAIRHSRGVNAFVDCSDDIDPELLHPDVEEEEEEEEDEPDDDPDDDDDADGDRGDDVDPGLRELEDDPDDADAEPDGDKGGKSADPAVDPDDDLDPEALAELAGESGKARMVPHARFHEVNEELKQQRAERLRLEEELARAKGAKPVEEAAPKEEPKPYDFDAAEDRYMDAVLDGDKDKARQIRSEIRNEERKQFENQSNAVAKQASEEQLQLRDAEAEKALLVKVLDEGLAKYPFLDNNSELANQDAIEDVIARRDLYLKQGMSASKAVAAAIEKVAPRYAPAADAGAEPQKPKPKADLTPEQVKRNLERERQIPQVMPGVGERGKDIDFANLSEDEFEALSEADKRKARGDFVNEKD